jgi:hypothetical protein
MRDICADLQDRIQLVAQQISAENTRFESIVSQLKAEQASKLEHMKVSFAWRTSCSSSRFGKIRCEPTSQPELQ